VDRSPYVLHSHNDESSTIRDAPNTLGTFGLRPTKNVHPLVVHLNKTNQQEKIKKRRLSKAPTAFRFLHPSCDIPPPLISCIHILATSCTPSHMVRAYSHSLMVVLPLEMVCVLNICWTVFEDAGRVALFLPSISSKDVVLSC